MTNLTEEIEKKFGITIDELSPAEKETYFSMLDAVQKSQLNPDKLRDYVISMREAVSKELVNEPEFTRVLFWKFENRKQIFLKARLLNYILLESFLISPSAARAQLENMIGQMVGRK